MNCYNVNNYQVIRRVLGEWFLKIGYKKIIEEKKTDKQRARHWEKSSAKIYFYRNISIESVNSIDYKLLFFYFLGMPNVEVSPSTVAVNESNPIHLVCGATGHPKPM